MIAIGTVLSSKYRLLRLLGDGGMGAVYEAQHERLGTHVAVKILHPDIARRPGIVERFLQEARVSAQIKSPHIVQVTDVEQTADGLAYLVMELLEGEPLSRVLERDHKLPVATACSYASQILEALEGAHALGVVHRDLKPENVFVTTQAGKRVLKLIDFGIAKVRRDDAAKNLTMAGVTMGTAEYMAPEQAFSADKADVRSDLYAVGVMLYEMISGTRPVMGEDARLIAMKVERGEITPLVHAAPDVPRDVAGLCHRAMAPRPDLRFQSAMEMRLAIEAALQKRSMVGEGAPAVTPAPPQIGIDPALHDVPASPTTQRGAPPLVFSQTAQATPVAPPAPHIAQMTPPIPTNYPTRKRSTGGGMIAVLIGVPVLLGVGIVVLLVLSHQDQPQPVVWPVPPTTQTVNNDPNAPPTSTLSDPLKPLGTTQPYVPTYNNTNVPHPVGDARAAAADGGVDTTDASPSNPFPFPSNFTFPSFDGGMVIPPFPSNFQLPQFPGAPPPTDNNH